MIRLSFVLPVYNVEKYLYNCLASLCRQSMSTDEYEIICVNDGSTDHSLAEIERFSTDNPDVRLHVETIPNSGQGKARNDGVAIASGRYIFFVDSDDYIADGVVKNLLDEAEKADADMLFFSGKRSSVTNDHINKPEFNDWNIQTPVLDGKSYYAERFPGNSPCIFLIKRDFITEKNVRFVEGRYCEDGMFAILATHEAARVTYRAVDVYRYAKRPNSTLTRRTKDHQEKLKDDFLFAVGYINRFIKMHKNDQSLEKYVARLIARRDSYTFFMLIRMIRLKMPSKEIATMIDQLKEEKCYPYASIKNVVPKKMKLLTDLFRHKAIYMAACRLYALVK